jgi:glutathione synthase
VERSRAIKCPSLAVHLAGCKKVQQVLAAPGVLERFMPGDDESAARESLRQTFAGLYAIEEDDAPTRALISDALAHPDQYVLKPQREGGGNNLWADEMVAALRSMTPAERAAFILMKTIKPRSTRAALLRKGKLLVADALSELGIYSAFVGDGNKVFHSELCGHLLRTKPVGVDEGGVAAGFSCLSSVLLQ